MRNPSKLHVYLYGIGPERIYMPWPGANAQNVADEVQEWLAQAQWQEVQTGSEIIRIRTAFVSRIEVR